MDVTLEEFIAWARAALSDERAFDPAQLETVIELTAQVVDSDEFARIGRPTAALVCALGGVARINRSRVEPDQPQALDQAIAWFGQALERAAPGDPNRPGYASNLATALTDRFERDGRRDDLLRALPLFAEATGSLRARDANAAIALHNEGLARINLYEADGDAGLLDTAVARLRDAVAVRHDDTVLRGEHLSSLGRALRLEALQRADRGPLTEAVTLLRTAAEAVAGTHHEVRTSTYLGNALFDLYEASNSVAVLLDARAAFEHAYAGVGDTGKQAARAHSNLGNVLLAMFRELGDESALERARRLLEQAVHGFEDGSPQQATCRTNLAACLQEMYEHAGRLGYLDEAIAHYGATVTPDRSSTEKLHNFGVSLMARFRRTEVIDDLRRAISLFTAAIEASSSDLVQRAASFNSLGNALFLRFDLTDDLDDLDHALAAHLRAVDDTADGSLDRAMYQGNVGVDLYTRGQRRERAEDIDEAIRRQELAASTVSEHSPDRIRLIAGLADSLAERASLRTHPGDAERARELYEQAARQGLLRLPEQAIGSATNWGDWALRRRDWHEAVRAYRYGLDAGDKLFRLHQLRRHRETWLQAVRSMPQNAAYAQVQTGDLTGAVETLERGRALLLSDALAQRSLEDAARWSHT